jgi:hypothetical protein
VCVTARIRGRCFGSRCPLRPGALVVERFALWEVSGPDTGNRTWAHAEAGGHIAGPHPLSGFGLSSPCRRDFRGWGCRCSSSDVFARRGVASRDGVCQEAHGCIGGDASSCASSRLGAGDLCSNPVAIAALNPRRRMPLNGAIWTGMWSSGRGEQPAKPLSAGSIPASASIFDQRKRAQQSDVKFDGVVLCGGILHNGVGTIHVLEGAVMHGARLAVRWSRSTMGLAEPRSATCPPGPCSPACSLSSSRPPA